LRFDRVRSRDTALESRHANKVLSHASVPSTLARDCQSIDLPPQRGAGCIARHIIDVTCKQAELPRRGREDRGRAVVDGRRLGVRAWAVEEGGLAGGDDDGGSVSGDPE
jgi:hypothetical protein